MPAAPCFERLAVGTEYRRTLRRPHRRARPLAPLRNVQSDSDADIVRRLPHPAGQAVLKRLAALLLLALASAPGSAADYVQAVEFPYYLYPRHALGARTGLAQEHRRADGRVLHPRGTTTRRSPAKSISLAPPARAATWWASSACCANSACAPGCVRSRRSRPGQRAAGCRAAARVAQAVGTGAGHADCVATADPSRSWKAARSPSMPPRLPRPSPLFPPPTRQRARAQPRQPSPPPAARCCGPTWRIRSIPRDGPPTRPLLLRKGAVGLSGDEHPATTALRRDAALLRGWARLFGRSAPRHHAQAGRRQTAGRRRRRRTRFSSRPAPSASPTRPASPSTTTCASSNPLTKTDAGDPRRDRGPAARHCGFR